ncbi:tRNA pseudouridine(55) synthase TruB [Desulforhopalus sp. IMCC35007]|uniref:tRNA pseudouridine(55) synthase TruB n=1 Tax=Desulforhopalus sp. IMCC35007 TaxID=2569543 RepID=UPI0010ADE378|nr:tRNA pseudouridine(55) synthase TruB [Desulforhopalus sp. IMCC35007]TKB10636.1 tRNA pseudouridine(55) synthase TruB [Desulforhopalus sp. IMCC35007]
MDVQEVEGFEAGVFLIDKPVDISSFGVVSRMRKILHMKKVGHAGTLDPFATGLLIVCAGRPATKLISQFMDGEKEYLATLRLGVETETLDTEGEIIKRREVGHISAEQIELCLAGFRGRQFQVPPAYSALKHQGKPLYYYARKGIKIEKEAREITISVLERTDGIADIVGTEGQLQIRVVCSKGTYIRTLAADIGSALGCGAHLTALRRTQSGRFSVGQSLNWDELSHENAIEFCMKKMISVEEVAKLLQ